MTFKNRTCIFNVGVYTSDIRLKLRPSKLSISHWSWRQRTMNFPACYLLYSYARFLLCLFFGPEDGGDMLLRNVGSLSTDYTALHPRRENSSTRSSLRNITDMFCARLYCVKHRPHRVKYSSLHFIVQ
jgi:hypothetical protein